jgi:NADPH2:quinone reductase
VKAIVFDRLGGPEVMELREVPDPVPGDGEVLVEVEAAGINFRDVYERLEDDYGADPPAIMGIEGGVTAANGGISRRAARRASCCSSRESIGPTA